MGEVTLECRNVTKAFGVVRVIDDLTLKLEAGKVTAIVGPNGAGKSTLFHLMTGFLAPDKGEVWYRKQRIDKLPAYGIARLGIGRLFQDVRVFETLTVLENVLTAFPRQHGENLALRFLRPGLVRADERINRAAAEQLLEQVGLRDQARSVAAELSYGQRKLLAIARLLALRADVLLLDEPSAGVSPAMLSSLVGLVKSLASEGRTVAVIEHNMNVVLESSDWVYFMDCGEVVSFGRPDEVLGNPAVRATYLGL